MRLVIVLATMVFSFFSLIGVIIVAKVFGFSADNFHNPDKIFDLSTMVMTLAVLILPILIVVLVQKTLLKSNLQEIGFKKPLLVPLLKGTAAGGLLKILSLTVAFVFSSSPQISFAPAGISFASWLPYFLWFLMALFLNSLNEELAYRSFPIQNSSSSKKLAHIYIWAFAAFFSMMHFIIEPPDLPHFAYRLAFGLLAGLLFFNYRSLWLIVGLHTGWNFIALTTTDAEWRTGNLFKVEAMNDSLSLWTNVAILFSAYAMVACTKRPR